MGAGHRACLSLPRPPQNCGLPSILDGPGPFTVFAPSNEAVDSLRDGRLIYLFTAVSERKEGAGDMGGRRASLSPTRPPAAKPSVPCQGLSKLQELVRYHIYNHGQVRVFLPEGGQLAPGAGLSGVCLWAPAFPGALLSLPVWTALPQSVVTWRDQVWPQGVWLVPSLRPPSPLPQLTVEKLISKGRVLTMANQVLAVNISEEVRSGAPGANGGGW